MVLYSMFVDRIRQDEIDMFYEICQKQRDYYRGRKSTPHPQIYMERGEYKYQCAPDIVQYYLNSPISYVKYKQPVVLPATTGLSSGVPLLPERSLRGRYNKGPCIAYAR